MKFLIVHIALVSLVASASVGREKQWEDFKLKFNRKYTDSNHETERRAVFEYNLDEIEKHNDLYYKGLSTYKQGINQFTDMTWEEFSNTVLMRTVTTDDSEPIIRMRNSVSSVPDTKDYRDIMNPVKDQGQCGSCWAFAAVGATEAAWTLAGHTTLSLSEQMLIDCGAGDCNGGWADRAFDTIIAKGGDETEADYPYTAHNGLTCKYDSSLEAASISSYERIYVNIEGTDALAESIADKGPHAVYIYANSGFQHYDSGIFDDESCSKYSYNHAVINVGYDKNDGTQGAWIIRNSWADSWGEDGHIRIVMGKNTCNVEHYAWIPTV